VRINRGLKHGIVEQLPAIDERGNVHRVLAFVVTPEEDEQIRTGYRCANTCMQVFDEPFPDECPVCKLDPSKAWFSPKKHQLEMYEKGRQPDHQYGPSPIDDYDYEQEAWTPKTGIWLPGKN
jgi:hypothetical protein